MEIIRFECSSCGKCIKVASHFAGHDGICPECRTAFVVPNPPDVAGAERETALEEIPVPKSDDKFVEKAVEQQSVRASHSSFFNDGAPARRSVPRHARHSADHSAPATPNAPAAPTKAGTPIHPMRQLGRAIRYSRKGLLVTGLAVIVSLLLLLMVPRWIAKMKVDRLIASAKAAHAEGRFEEAMELLNKAHQDFDADDRDEARDLLSQYEHELKPPESSSAASTPYLNTVSQKSFGKSLADFQQAMPFLSKGIFTRGPDGDGGTHYRWEFGSTLIVDMHGADQNINSLMVSVGIRPTDSPQQKNAKWAVAVLAVQAASGEKDAEGIAKWLSDAAIAVASDQTPRDRQYGGVTVKVASALVGQGGFIAIAIDP